MTKQKHCPDCNKWLDIKFFGHNKNNDDGLAFYCKSCYNERRYASKDRSFLSDVATLIAEKVIKNTRIERIAADLLLRSCHSRMNDEFPCMWDDRIDFARDCILKIEGFWKTWVKLSKAFDNETNATEKRNLRPSIDRIIEHPSVGYRLENIQALSNLGNTLKTIQQRYDVLKWEENTILSDQRKSDIIKKFSLDADELRQLIDGGLHEIEGELYLFQSKDRSEGKHSEIIKELSNENKEIPEEHAIKLTIKVPVKVPIGDDKFIPMIMTMPFIADKRYVSAHIKDIKKEPSTTDEKAIG